LIYDVNLKQESREKLIFQRLLSLQVLILKNHISILKNNSLSMIY